MKKEVLYIKNVPIGLKHQFKAACARRNVSMTQRIIQFMKADTKGERQHGVQRIDEPTGGEN